MVTRVSFSVWALFGDNWSSAFFGASASVGALFYFPKSAVKKLRGYIFREREVENVA